METLSNSEMVSCKFAGVCSGCSWIKLSYQEQLSLKKNQFIQKWRARQLPEAALDTLQILPIAPDSVRDRLDFVFKRQGDRMTFGMYDDQRHRLVDIDDCPQLTERLQSWLTTFISKKPPIDVGSVRLRTAPNGQRGAWLDFSHVDTKALLDEQHWLEWLLSESIVEVGQRRKRLLKSEQGLKLSEASVYPWFETFIDDQPIPLFMCVGSFSQVGFTANKVLIHHFMDRLPDDLTGTWLELGAGSGNLTLPLAARGVQVTAIEIDPLALMGLNQSAIQAKLDHKITILKADFQNVRGSLSDLISQSAGLVVDPPRNGLGHITQIVKSLDPNNRPRHIIYLSCFADSLLGDLKILLEAGYRMTSLCGIDQFPQTPHCEFLVALEHQ